MVQSTLCWGGEEGFPLPIMLVICLSASFALDYSQLPSKCNPCCTSNAHPFSLQGVNRCGSGSCPSYRTSLDERGCAISFNDDATLSNGVGGDSFNYWPSLTHAAGALENSNMVRGGGHRFHCSHPRGPNGAMIGANSCCGGWGSGLLFLGDEYRLASGNTVFIDGHAASGYVKCGGFDDGRGDKSFGPYTGVFGGSPQTHSLDACEGAQWLLVESTGSCGSAKVDKTYVVQRKPPSPPPPLPPPPPSQPPPLRPPSPPTMPPPLPPDYPPLSTVLERLQILETRMAHMDALEARVAQLEADNACLRSRVGAERQSGTRKTRRCILYPKNTSFAGLQFQGYFESDSE